jgi:hypothetical protein
VLHLVQLIGMTPTGVTDRLRIDTIPTPRVDEDVVKGETGGNA